MEDTLVLAYIIFRHGDRTPDEDALYPNDPHKDNEYYPYGYGQLTNAGKRRSYKLGQVLRSKYDNLLGDLYSPELIEAHCTEFDRTQTTLQIVLAALFPPKQEQIWEETLLWQPIPYKYGPKLEEKIFLYAIYNPDAKDLYQRYMNGPGKTILENHCTTVRCFEEGTGLVINSVRKILTMAGTFRCQVDWGLKLPDWTNKIWPGPIENLGVIEYDILAGPELRSYACGGLLTKILTETKLKIEGKFRCKIQLYSGHDVNIGSLLLCLGFNVDHIPLYCSNLRLELHRIHGIYGFKVYYQRDLDKEPEMVPIVSGNCFCPLEDFEALVKDVAGEMKTIYTSSTTDTKDGIAAWDFKADGE